MIGLFHESNEISAQKNPEEESPLEESSGNFFYRFKIIINKMILTFSKILYFLGLVEHFWFSTISNYICD